VLLDDGGNRVLKRITRELVVDDGDFDSLLFDKVC
jgi:hypothetical protein